MPTLFKELGGCEDCQVLCAQNFKGFSLPDLYILKPLKICTLGALLHLALIWQYSLVMPGLLSILCLLNRFYVQALWYDQYVGKMISHLLGKILTFTQRLLSQISQLDSVSSVGILI